MDDKWSGEDFPQDLFDQILNLCSLRDRIRAGLVCKSWLRVSKLNASRHPQLPLLMPCNPNSNSAERAGEENRCVYSLSDDTIYYDIKIPRIRGKSCCGSFINSDGWLISVDSKEVRLFHPWRRIELKLPRLSFLYDISPSKAAISDDAAVVAVMNSLGNFACCRTREDKIWTSICLPKSVTSYQDIIYHEGQFYAVSSNGTIVVVSITRNSPCVKNLIEGGDFFSKNCRVRKATVVRGKTYLVLDSASKGIFIIRRFAQVGGSNNWNHCSTYDFQVFELGIEETTGTYKKTLVEVENLGDRVIFLGLNSTMIVMASQFPGLKGNCIYFTHDWALQREGEFDMGIFNMKDRAILPLFLNGAHPSFSRSIWIRPPSPGGIV